ncbi:MAG TPA: GDP-L-fucose synthase [Candidatus Polarisedimenticolia bacterium]|nr:GDP-L-fucose synthase [Candidatus Polarisedimenticolia bacterium]
MDPHASVYVAGHRGMVGSALVKRLRAAGHSRLVLRTREELDLTRREAVEEFFLREKPGYVFLAAGRVGGIQANQASPADFIRDNLLIQTSVLHAAHRSGVKRLIFFAGSCLYPRECPQPMKEEAILTGPMEQTSEAYSTSKLAGYMMCEAYNRQYGTQFLTVIPATLYGPGDNFDPATSHVLSALIRRFHEQRRQSSVTVWGTGRPVREFLYVDDLAEACVLLMDLPGPLPGAPINIGTGRGTSIKELAESIAGLLGYRGSIQFDASKPDGAPIKVLDSSRIHSLGWASRTSLQDGLRRTYEWYLSRN